MSNKAELINFLDIAKKCDYLEKATFGDKWARWSAESGIPILSTEFNGICLEKPDVSALEEKMGLSLVYTKPVYRIFDKETKKHTVNLEVQFSYRTYVWKNGILNTYTNFDNNQVIVDLFSTHKEEFEEICAFFKNSFVFRINEEKCPVYALQRTQQGTSLLEFGGIEKNIIRDNYTDEILKNFDLIVKDIKTDAPSGRVSILTGPPGTGKSWFIRGLVKECPKAKFVVIQPDMVSALSGPDLISLFVGEKSKDDGPIVLIIEDGDICISRREGGDMGLVSSVLNMGDGILGQLLDIRLVITSNLGVDDLDEAVTRPGRMNQYASFTTLSVEHSALIYKRETGEDKVFETPKTLAEVYNDIHKKNDDAFVPQPKKKRIGFDD